MKHLLLSTVLITQVPLIAQSSSARQETGGQMDDQKIVEFAHNLLGKQRVSNDELQTGLRTIQNYVFKDKNAPEKEYLLYAQGILEDRTDQLTRSVVTFRRFERAYPNSQYMPEAHYVLGRNALDKKTYKEAETRFRKVIESDLPIESKYNAQGLLVWLLVEQKRMSEAIPLVQTLFPIGKSKPDERALIAIMQVQCEAKALEAAKRTRTAYLAAYRESANKSRINLMWGLMLGQTGQSVESARALREVIRDAPRSEYADEARLALATIIADGKLPDRANPTNDSVDSLLAQLKTAGVGGDAQQRALLLQLRLASDAQQWDSTISLADKYLRDYPDSPPENQDAVRTYKDNATNAINNGIRASIQEKIDSGGLLAAMPLLTAKNIALLSPELRSNLVSSFAQTGLPEAAVKIIQASPDNEQEALRKVLSDNIADPLPPPLVLASIDGNLKGYKGELGQIQTLLSGKKWNDASIRIEKLEPGADRIKAILALLLRPMPSGEIHLRRKEAEGWLARCTEPASVKEPLVIFIADMYMRTDNSKEALSLYPEKPQSANLGWVSLMRATAMTNLGQKDAAKRVIMESDSVPEFRQYRQALARQLNK